jgi:hypothetical protein
MATKKNGKLKEFLYNLWYYVSEAFTMAVLLVLVVLGALAGCFAALFLAVAPMYVSPWWGLLSVPGTLTLVIAVVLWRIDR